MAETEAWKWIQNCCIAGVRDRSVQAIVREARKLEWIHISMIGAYPAGESYEQFEAWRNQVTAVIGQLEEVCVVSRLAMGLVTSDPDTYRIGIAVVVVAASYLSASAGSIE